ncbi:hypothetical protein MPSEU_000038700 [Mayamaea pseudoterrestris]|nr:hypothetical protein MPSEU_000038700 [Mayamaea pseudoterrestris]
MKDLNETDRMAADEAEKPAKRSKTAGIEEEGINLPLQVRTVALCVNRCFQEPGLTKIIQGYYAGVLMEDAFQRVRAACLSLAFANAVDSRVLSIHQELLSYLHYYAESITFNSSLMDCLLCRQWWWLLTQSTVRHELIMTLIGPLVEASRRSMFELGIKLVFVIEAYFDPLEHGRPPGEAMTQWNRSFVGHLCSLNAIDTVLDVADNMRAHVDVAEEGSKARSVFGVLNVMSAVRLSLRQDDPSHDLASIDAFTSPSTHAFTTAFDRPSIHQSRRLSSTVSVESSLESLTVKELRELVKQRTDFERGVMSRLKRKQDLIDYLSTTETSNHDEPQAKIADEMQVEIENLEEIAVGSAVVPLIGNEDAPRKVVEETSSQQAKRLPIKHLPLPDSASVSSTDTILTAKDIILQDVYRRYPPVGEEAEAAALLHASIEAIESCNNETSFTTDIRQNYHPMLQAIRNVSATSDMDLVFIGTASCTPGVTRGVSCTALRLNWKRKASTLAFQDGKVQAQSKVDASGQGFQGGTWLFDVGECTQLQVQRTSCIRPSKITKIFLTHAHGDHSFGLPGLLCLMGQDRDRDSNGPPIEIYGPEGLRMWLRVAIRYSVSRIVPPYRVHEVMNVPMAPEWEYSHRSRRFYRRAWTGKEASMPWVPKGLAGEDGINWISQANRLDLEPSSMYGEIDGGRNIYPINDHPRSVGGAPVWEIEDEGDVKVFAAPMSHGIPCLGYAVEELPRAGRLRNELVAPMVKRNFAALKDAGFKVPMKALAVIKDLSIGSSFTFPDGTVITQEEALEPPRPGRKVVVCGDTADARALHKLAQGADVVVHEATNSYLSGVDKDTNLREVTRDAVLHGHSTPHLAGDFARAVEAKRLVLNHFSARYKGDVSADSLSIMMRIERQAIKTSKLDETQVAAAWDLMVVPIPRRR